MKKKLALMFCSLILTSSLFSNVALASTEEPDLMNLPSEIIETPLDGEIKMFYYNDPSNDKTPIDNEKFTDIQTRSNTNVFNARSNTTVGIKDVRKTTFNDFYPLTQYARGKCNLTYSTSTSFTVSASYSLGCSVDLEFIKVNYNSTLGDSTTINASESVSYEIPSGYQGRIVIRYYQDRYDFTCYKTVTYGSQSYTTTKEGCYAYTAAYGAYYARQLISLS